VHARRRGVRLGICRRMAKQSVFAMISEPAGDLVLSNPPAGHAASKLERGQIEKLRACTGEWYPPAATVSYSGPKRARNTPRVTTCRRCPGGPPARACHGPEGTRGAGCDGAERGVQLLRTSDRFADGHSFLFCGAARPRPLPALPWMMWNPWGNYGRMSRAVFMYRRGAFRAGGARGSREQGRRTLSGRGAADRAGVKEIAPKSSRRRTVVHILDGDASLAPSLS
jgi:hypothetical protein